MEVLFGLVAVHLLEMGPYYQAQAACHSTWADGRTDQDRRIQDRVVEARLPWTTFVVAAVALVDLVVRLKEKVVPVVLVGSD